MAEQAKASLIEIPSLSESQDQLEQNQGSGKRVTVDFNPQTLKVSFANQNSGGNQPAGSSSQYVGSPSSKLTVELLFDSTEAGTDVRIKTRDVAYFMSPKLSDNEERTPPFVRFQWGSFIFEGKVDSMDETLEYFSEEGMPLRAVVALNLSSDTGVFLLGRSGTANNAVQRSPATGATTPLKQARPGDNLPQMAGRNGRSGDWKAIAAANNIDDPLRLPAGALINLNLRG